LCFIFFEVVNPYYGAAYAYNFLPPSSNQQQQQAQPHQQQQQYWGQQYNGTSGQAVYVGYPPYDTQESQDAQHEPQEGQEQVLGEGEVVPGSEGKDEDSEDKHQEHHHHHPHQHQHHHHHHQTHDKDKGDKVLPQVPLVGSVVDATTIPLKDPASVGEAQNGSLQ
jgi:hypothetical protein